MRFRKIIKALIIFLFIIAGILLLIIISLNLPYSHRLITKKVNTILENSDLPIHIRSVKTIRPNDIYVQGIDISGPENDTIFYAEEIHADLVLSALLSRKIMLRNIFLGSADIELLRKSATGQLNIVTVFSLDKSDKIEAKTKDKKRWEVSAANIILSEVNIIYNDQPAGLMMKLVMDKGIVKANNLDIINKIIDINNISVFRTDAIIIREKKSASTISNGENSPFDFPWKITGKDVKLEDVSFRGINSVDTVINQNSAEIGVSGLDMRISDIALKGTGAGFVLRKLNCDLDNGFAIEKMNGEFESRQGASSLSMAVETANSKLNVEGAAGMSLFDIIKRPSEISRANVIINNSLFSLKDIFYFRNDLQSIPFLSALGNEQLIVKGKIDLKDSTLILPGISVFQRGNFDIKLDGRVENCFHPMDAVGDINIGLSDINTEFLIGILKEYGLNKDFSEIKKLSLIGHFSDSLRSPDFDIEVNSDLGNINLFGSIDFKKQIFTANSTFDKLMPGKILGIEQLGSFTGSAELASSGFKADSLSGNFTLFIDALKLKGYEYTNARVKGNLQLDRYDFDLLIDDPFIKCKLNSVINPGVNSFTINAQGTLFAQLNELHLLDDTLAFESSISANIQKESSILNTDFSLSKLKLSSPGNDALVNQIQAYFRSDTSRTIFAGNGDFFKLEGTVEKPLNELETVLQGFRNYAESFIDPLHFSSEARISYLPEMEVLLNISYNRALNMAIQDSSLQFSKLDISLNNKISDSTVNYNITGAGIVYKQAEIDILNASLVDSAGTMNLNINGEKCSINSIPLNRLLISSNFAKRQGMTRVSLIGKQDEILYNFNISLESDSNNIVLKVPSEQLIMNGTQWQLDTPELLYINRATKAVSPALRMHTGNSILHLLPDTGSADNSIQCELSNVVLSSLIRGNILPGNPAGKISGYLYYRPLGENGRHLNTDMRIRDVSWSDLNFKDISLIAKYISQTPEEFEIDLSARLDTSSIIIKGGRKSNSESLINADFKDVPINTVQPFVKDFLSEIRGSISGYFNISSKDSIKIYNSGLNIHGGSLRINSLNSTYKIPDDKVQFSDKRMVFKNFMILDSLSNKLLIDGSIDFSNIKSITADLGITSSKLQLMNKAEDNNSPFYGNIFIDSKLKINGPISSPIIRGRILLSEGTEIFYVKKEDLNSTESENTVRFVSESPAGESGKSQLLEVPIIRSNGSIETIVEIDPTTRINVELSEKLYNIGLIIQGGGILNYSMSSNNRSNLSGTYEISEGTAQLNMVGWPNKEFRISQGGYIRWEGNIEDPEINIEALNRVRSSYKNPVDGKERDVDFNVTLKLSNKLSDLIVLFNINTPDQYLMSIINTLSPEEQMKQAITILLFQKIDLPGISSSTDYITEQVNQFVSSQLNQLTKTTIKGIDISFGIDSYVQATEAGGEETKTSLSYEFKRTLLDDRAQIEFSGRLNDFNKQPGASDLSLNNFSFEYRLDSASTLFLKVYNELTYEDVFEGEVVKTGVGVTYRKSYRHFKDIWRRKRKTGKIKKQ